MKKDEFKFTEQCPEWDLLSMDENPAWTVKAVTTTGNQVMGTVAVEISNEITGKIKELSEEPPNQSFKDEILKLAQNILTAIATKVNPTWRQ
jgi:thymidine phosphorylase